MSTLTFIFLKQTYFLSVEKGNLKNGVSFANPIFNFRTLYFIQKLLLKITYPMNWISPAEVC
jgi:hypothetical protein